MKKCLPVLLLFAQVSGAFSQDIDKAIADIDSRLIKGQTTISAILSDPANMHLHAKTAFREVIKKHAKPEKLTMITKDEPGKRITVKISIIDPSGKPLNNTVVYLYHTSDKGWYSDTAAHITTGKGDHGHARLFCYAKTDANGQLEIKTIQAKGYPSSDLPAHIHLQAWRNGKLVTGLPGELLFEDDPRLTPDRKTRAIREGFLVEKNTGSASQPLYFYKINLED